MSGRFGCLEKCCYVGRGELDSLASNFELVSGQCSTRSSVTSQRSHLEGANHSEAPIPPPRFFNFTPQQNKLGNMYIRVEDNGCIQADSRGVFIRKDSVESSSAE